MTHWYPQQPDLTWTIMDEENDSLQVDKLDLPASIQIYGHEAAASTRPYELMLLGVLLFAILGYITWQEVKIQGLMAEAETSTPAAEVQAEIEAGNAGSAPEQLALIELEVDPTALNALPVPYRSKRFYHLMDGVWQPITPGVEYWGEQRTLETDHFRLVYYELDAEAVETVAAELDSLLRTLRRQVGLAEPIADEKLVIQVLPNSSHHRRTLNPFRPPIALPVASPTLLPIPAELSEADVLRSDILQHLASLTLFRKVAPASREAWWGDPGVQGLLRWLIAQESELPTTLARHNTLDQDWRQQLVDGPAPHLAEISVQRLQPQKHNLYWVESYLIPELDWQTMLVETAIDYALTTYGQAHLPQLLEAIRRQDSWTAIVPAVFEVSVETFESGWHEYLTRRSQ